MTKEEKKKIIKFIEHIARSKVQDNLVEVQLFTLKNNLAKEHFDEEKFLEINFNEIKQDYFDLWKEMFNEDLQEKEQTK